MIRALALRDTTCGHPIGVGDHRDELLPLLIAYRQHGHTDLRIQTISSHDQLEATLESIVRGDSCDHCTIPGLTVPRPERKPE
jgi:hypothetical protein